MIGVKVRTGYSTAEKEQNLTTALRKFNQKVVSSNILTEYINRMHYTKPKTKRRRAKLRRQFISRQFSDRWD